MRLGSLANWMRRRFRNFCQSSEEKIQMNKFQKTSFEDCPNELRWIAFQVL